MGDLPSLARKLETTPIASLMAAAAAGRPAFFLSLDHDEPPGIALRPHLPGVHGEPTGLGADPRLLAAAAATPLSQLLEPMRPDPAHDRRRPRLSRSPYRPAEPAGHHQGGVAQPVLSRGAHAHVFASDRTQAAGGGR
jgi:hypothetical protein